MSTTASLSGTLSLGGSSGSAEAAVGTAVPVVFNASVANVDFPKMVDDVLGAGFLKPLPSRFPTIIFDRVRVRMSTTAFALHATTNVQWKNPFGFLNGLTFGPLHVQLDAGDVTDLTFSADVTYGTMPTLSGEILFVGGQLLVAAASLSNPLSIGDFLLWSLPGGVNWNQLLPITFGPQTEGGSARIYYAIKKTNGYVKGFNIDQAKIDVLGFSANVTLNADDGIVVRGSLDDPIDFGFLRLSGSGRNGSPVVSAVSSGGTKSFGLASQINFLGKDAPATVSVAVQEVGSSFGLAASITYQGNLGPFADPSFAFTWSRDRGFEVKDWPVSDFDGSSVMHYDELLNKANTSQCAVFVKDMFHDTIKTRFNFKAQMASSNGDATPQPLTIIFSGTYTISVAGIGDVLTVPLPADLPVELSLPGDFTFQALGDKLLRLIANAAESMVQQIIGDPERSATFFAIVITNAALAQVLAMLACRKWQPPPDPGGGNPGGGGGGSPAVTPPPPVPLPFNPGSSGGRSRPGETTITALTFTAGDLLQATWSTSSDATGYATSLSDGETLTVPNSWPSTSATIAVQEAWPPGHYGLFVQGTNGGGAGDWSVAEEIVRLGGVTDPALAQNGNSLTLIWTPNSHGAPWDAATGYEYNVFLPSGDQFLRATTSGPATSVALTLPPGAASGLYTARVRAVGGSTMIASQWSVPATLVVTPVALPGWTVSIDNTSTTESIEARVTDPASTAVTTIAPQATTLLPNAPISGFLVWRTSAATAKTEFVFAQQVTITTSGATTTLSYADIVTGTLTDGFTAINRTGVLAGDKMFFSDVLTVQAMTAALQPFLTSPADLELLLVGLYPTLTPAALAQVLVAAFTSPPISANDLALTIVRAFPKTSANDLAIILVAALPVPITPTPLAQALVAAYGFTDAGVTPLLAALWAGWNGNRDDITAATAAIAVKTALALSSTNATPLAGPLSQQFALTRTPNDVAALAVALYRAGFSLDATTIAFSKVFIPWTAAAFGRVLTVFASGEWNLAILLQTQGQTPSAAAATIRQQYPLVTSADMVLIIASVFGYTHADVGVTPVAEAMKAAAYSLDDASVAMSSFFTPWTAADFGRVLAVYNN
jgi:hypothetical protein